MTLFLKKSKIKGLSLKRLCLASAIVQAVKEGRAFAFRGRRGFSLIGVMVASSVGLIVVMGMSQMFANMSAQMKGIENQTKRVFFINFVGDELNKNCIATLQAGRSGTTGGTLSNPRTGTARTFNQIRVLLRNGTSFDGQRIMKEYGTNYRSVLDLTGEEDRLEAEYGLSKGSYFRYECIEGITPGCTCSSTAYTCEKKWRIGLITRKEVNGVWILDKPYSFETNIRFNSTLPECGNVTLIGGGGGTSISDACILAETSTRKQTIAGCPAGTGPTSSVVQGHTAYGYDVGTQGQYNTFIGYTAGTAATTGGNNVFLGYETGKSNTTGEHNVFLGRSAGESNTTASYNTFTGSNAGNDNTTGKGNVFLGYQAGKSNTTGGDNVFLGYQAGLGNTKGIHNTFLGYQAGRDNVGGSFVGQDNVYLGYQAGLTSNSIANTFVGAVSGKDNTSGSYNTFIGNSAGASNTTAKENSFIGGSAGISNKTGNANVFIGYQAGASNVGGVGNTFLGHRAGRDNTASWNTFLGHRAGRDNTTGLENTFVGYRAGESNTLSRRNTFLGYEAGVKNASSGNDNVFMGYQAGMNNTHGSYNVFVGNEAGKDNASGGDNIFIGYQAGRKNKNKGQNTFIGNYSGAKSTGGSYNTFFGYYSGYENTVGEANVFFGERAGQNNKTGNDNTFLGLGAGAKNTTGSGNVFIGRDAARTNSYKTLSDRFVVGNAGNEDWIVGEIGTDDISINTKRVCLAGATISGCAAPPSSRTVKKNIKLFKSFENALKDLLKTPLFVYQYKEKAMHPEKKRMGIISEELPEHLQLKSKDHPPQPDWPSIYGTFWASIKALYNRLEEVRKTFSAQIEELKTSLKNLWEGFADFKKSAFESFAGKKELEEVRQELLQTKRELSSVKEGWAKTDQELSQTKSELKELKKQFQSFVKKPDKNQ